MQLRRLATLAALVMGLSTSALAQLVFNTGVDSLGIKLAPGNIDPHWQAVTPSGTSVVTISPHPSYSIVADAAWIWAANVDGVNAMLLRLTFDLSGYDHTTATLSGTWGADNVGTVALNGTIDASATLTSALVDHFQLPFRSFAFAGGDFVAGLNTLDLDVQDLGGPAAVIVSELQLTVSPVVTHAVPEPSTYGLLGLGLLAGLIAWRRRRS